MKKYLLPEIGQYYKACLHCHSNVSDGDMTPEEMKKVYMEQGYSIIAYTDHDVLVPHPELADEKFLPLNSYEMEITQESDSRLTAKTCHMCLIALEPDNLKQVCFHRSKYMCENAMQYLDKIQYDETAPDYERYYTHECINDVMKKARDSGFFVTYNHPVWSLESYNDYIGYNHMHAMEIVNNECLVCGWPDYNEKEYDDMLRAGKRIYCIAADDSHVLKGCFGGFTMIKADKLEYRTITKALEDGNFYASQGPKIHNLWFEDGVIHIDCEDVQEIRFNTGRRRAKLIKGENGEFVNSGEFELRIEDVYVRVTITDATGKHANTNAYFTDELFE